MRTHIRDAGRNIKRLDLNDLAFRRHVRSVLRLGERVLAELLAEIESDPADIPGKLARYAALDPEALRVTGGHQFPPVLFAVPDSIRAGRANRRGILRRSLISRPDPDGPEAA